MITRHPQSRLRGMAPDEAASYWLVRLDGDAPDRCARAEFEAWYAASPVNAAAFERAKTAWSVFDQADGDPHLGALRESALAVGSGPRRSIWLALGAAIAASLIAALTWHIDVLPPASVEPRRVVSAPASATPPAARPDRGEFVTAKGERRTIDLADGTTLTLNTDSAVRVAYAPERRLIRVLRGQVLFEVAKDRRRPFVVQAADRQVTALGTVFEVRLDRDRMKVTLVEGKVVVDAISDRPANAALFVPTVLAPGQEFIASIGAVPQLANADVGQQLRWREGFVEFDDVPLATAVKEMNRYSARQLVIDSAATGNLRIGGVFRTGNPERFAAIIGELLPVEYHSLADSRIELRAVEQASR